MWYKWKASETDLALTIGKCGCLQDARIYTLLNGSFLAVNKDSMVVGRFPNIDLAIDAIECDTDHDMAVFDLVRKTGTEE